jgi:Cu-Zn family superoxide dismutase
LTGPTPAERPGLRPAKTAGLAAPNSIPARQTSLCDASARDACAFVFAREMANSKKTDNLRAVSPPHRQEIPLMNPTVSFLPSSLRRVLTLTAALFATVPLLCAADAISGLAMPAPAAAVAVLIPTKGNAVQGVVHFTRVANGVHVVARVSGLKPGEHGFHIHEYGDASSPDGTAAGGHFNPEHKDHGGPTVMDRHAGDLGNLQADADGNATVDYVDEMITLDGAESIIGRGVIVHADPDDFKTQPTGNAGKRVACGVIGIAKQ